jgi:hypothetical protein
MDYTKINANDQLDIKGSCLAGCYGDGLTYAFNIYKLNNQTNQFEIIRDTSFYYQYTYLTTYLIVMSEFFKNEPNQIIYKLEYSVMISSRNLSSSAFLLIYVNFPPDHGTCDITPKKGTVLNTQFTITCSDFVDKDGFLVYYSFYGKYIFKLLQDLVFSIKSGSYPKSLFLERPQGL